MGEGLGSFLSLIGPFHVHHHQSVNGPPPHQGEQSQAFGCSAHFRDVQMPVEVKSEFIYDP